MTPPAQHAAGIDILEAYLSGVPAEKALTNWARRNRYAGSKDRAAIRDLVFDVLRRRRSCAASGGGTGARALVLGHLRLKGGDPEAIFCAARYAPPSLSERERKTPPPVALWPEPVRLDYPDWLDQALRDALGDRRAAVMALLRQRAAVFVRVNRRKTDRNRAIASLAAEGIGAVAEPLAPHALRITENRRRIVASAAYRQGLIELQDAASQAVVAALPLPQTGRILDYCAGGGGKALALAAVSDAEIFAHDNAPARMRDLPARMARAGVQITRLSPEQLRLSPRFDLVFCDVPCSGSGAWRRAPAGKWALTPARLIELTGIQREILHAAADLVRPGGILAYATCSMLKSENTGQIAGFLAETADFSPISARQFTPLDGGDGMFVSILRAKK